MKYLIIVAVLPQILGQFVGDLSMKPDVTFGDQNERFDLTSLVERQNRYHDRHTYADDEDEYRRHGRKAGGLKILHPNGLLEDFGYHTSRGNAGTASDYEDNLKKLLTMNNRRAQRLVQRLHEDVKAWRRSNSNPELSETNKDSVTEIPPDPEKEVLMHHAVPVELTIQGYLQAPLVV